MVALEIRNEQERVETDDKLVELLEKVTQKALERLGMDDDPVVSLTFTDDPSIKELNRKWRGVDAPTDVLSFAMEEGEDDGFFTPEGEARLLGDVVISLERAAAQADEYGHSFERETAYLLVHGILHLAGYDHEDEAGRAEMRALEEEVLEGLGITR